MSKADYYVHNPRRANIENRLKILLNYTLNENDKELITFQNRLIKYQHYIFTFLYRPEVPPDNNASERAIRNIKVKQKISGMALQLYQQGQIRLKLMNTFMERIPVF